jgi:hypothetical protein
MSITWLLILLPVLLVICFFVLAAVGAGLDNSQISCTVVIAALASGLALLVDIILLLVLGFRSNTQLTGLITVSGLLAGGFAWAFKSIRETLFQRAQVLILEYLSDEPLRRSEIRARIYEDGYLFRLNRSIYIDALSALSNSGKVKIVNGRYVIADSEPP